MNEGQSVAWTGPGETGLSAGDQGTLLALSFSGSRQSAHVMWATGSRAGCTDLVDVVDLAPTRQVQARTLIEDSLEDGGLTSFAALDVYEASGATGLLNVMAETGHLAAFAGIAEQTLAMVSAQVRQDPSFRHVVASLDEESGEALVRLASVCLIRDAFGSEDES